MVENKIKTTLTVHQAYIKAQKYCAYQERSQSHVRSKLNEWKIKESDAENIIAQLINDNFLNEERFAKAFARGKFRIKKWGKNKIKLLLQQLEVSPYCIKKALSEIDNNEYHIALKQLINKNVTGKITSLSLPQKYALIKKMMSKGYEQDLVWNILNNMSK